MSTAPGASSVSASVKSRPRSVRPPNARNQSGVMPLNSAFGSSSGWSGGRPEIAIDSPGGRVWRRSRRLSAPGAFLQSLVQIRSGELPRGSQAEERAGEQGNAEGESQRRSIEPHFVQARDVAGTGGDEQLQSPPAEQGAETAADRREHDAFDQ